MQPIKDPVTFDIIQNSLEAIADEMFAAMRKTAMSAIMSLRLLACGEE